MTAGRIKILKWVSSTVFAVITWQNSCIHSPDLVIFHELLGSAVYTSDDDRYQGTNGFFYGRTKISGMQ
jgi:hypothetical protein